MPGPAAGRGRPGGLAGALAAGQVRAAATNLARDLSNEPANALHPADLAAAARKLLAGKGVTVKVKDEKELAAEGFGGIVGVGQGAEHPPRLIELRYAPKGAVGAVVLVGKGITFDSGGLSLKPADSMKTMKTDMSGAAAVLATMTVLAELDVKVAVTGYLASAENMPSGRATRPGDVLTMKNGKTVEVLNTDAEGRLVMADALALGAASKPDAIIDVATLTGACAVALGNRYTGLMANDEALAAELLDAAAEAGEPTWRLPCRPSTARTSRATWPTSRTSATATAAPCSPACSSRSSSTTAPGPTSTSPAPPGPSPRTATSPRAPPASPSAPSSPGSSAAAAAGDRGPGPGPA